MPGVGHVAVGCALARLGPGPRAEATLGQRLRLAAVLSGLALLPDADVIAFALRIPYSAPWGHRGAAHSIAFGLGCAALVAAAAPRLLGGRLRTLVVAAVALVSHGLLDALTDGGLGVALLWPLSNARYFSPWRPIPVSAIGPRALSPAGLQLIAHELLLFAPLWAVALWPRRKPRTAADRDAS